VSYIEECVLDYKYVVEKLDVSETTAALLVLAASVESAAPFGKYKAENFGHELALALKCVFEREIKVDLGGSIVTEVTR
jgi:hypothetical protein